jgi:hypothetical protein
VVITRIRASGPDRRRKEIALAPSPIATKLLLFVAVEQATLKNQLHHRSTAVLAEADTFANDILLNSCALNSVDTRFCRE